MRAGSGTPLLDAFPDATVLHTVRDPDRWYDSTLETIYPAQTMVAPWVRRALPFVDRKSIRRRFNAVRLVTHGAPWVAASGVAVALGRAATKRITAVTKQRERS